jgi:hypothetical protein
VSLAVGKAGVEARQAFPIGLIGYPVCWRARCGITSEPAIGNQRPMALPPKSRQRHQRRSAPQVVFVGRDEVRIGESERIQFAQDVAECCQWVRIPHVIEDAAGGEANAHAVGAPHFDYGLGYFQSETGPVRGGAAVLIRAVLGAIVEKLVQQITGSEQQESVRRPYFAAFLVFRCSQTPSSRMPGRACRLYSWAVGWDSASRYRILLSPSCITK